MQRHRRGRTGRSCRPREPLARQQAGTRALTQASALDSCGGLRRPPFPTLVRAAPSRHHRPPTPPTRRLRRLGRRVQLCQITRVTRRRHRRGDRVTPFGAHAHAARVPYMDGGRPHVLRELRAGTDALPCPAIPTLARPRGAAPSHRMGTSLCGAACGALRDPTCASRAAAARSEHARTPPPTQHAPRCLAASRRVWCRRTTPRCYVPMTLSRCAPLPTSADCCGLLWADHLLTVDRG